MAASRIRSRTAPSRLPPTRTGTSRSRSRTRSRIRSPWPWATSSRRLPRKKQRREAWAFTGYWCATRRTLWSPPSEARCTKRNVNMSDAFIVGGVRTPVGNLGGGLSDVRPDDLASHAIAESMRRHPSVDPWAIANVVLGCANQAGEDNPNVARMALLLAGLPHSVPGETINRLCASGMSAAAATARAARLGEGDVFVAGGVESMTRAPYALSKASKPWARDLEIFDTSLGWRFVNPKMKERYGTDSMGQTAENVAEKYGVSRNDQDCFALRSQQKAAAARSAGRFAEEIVPVEIAHKKGEMKQFDQDEFLRPDPTLEGLAKLKPAFRTDGKGSVTAGNASGLNDGAAALLVASERGLRQFGLEPIARFVSAAVA